MKKFVEKNWVQHFFTNMAEKVNPKNNYKDIMNFLKGKKGLVDGSVALLSVLICQYFIKRVVSPFLSVPAGEQSKKIGLIKPKLYEGETFDKKRDFSMFHNEDIKKLYDKVMGENNEKESK